MEHRAAVSGIFKRLLTKSIADQKVYAATWPTQQNVVSRMTALCPIDFGRILYHLPCAKYEQARFPAIITRWIDSPWFSRTVLMFKNGNIVNNGARRDIFTFLSMIYTVRDMRAIGVLGYDHVCLTFQVSNRVYHGSLPHPVNILEFYMHNKRATKYRPQVFPMANHGTSRKMLRTRYAHIYKETPEEYSMKLLWDGYVFQRVYDRAGGGRPFLRRGKAGSAPHRTDDGEPTPKRKRADETAPAWDPRDVDPRVPACMRDAREDDEDTDVRVVLSDGGMVNILYAHGNTEVECIMRYLCEVTKPFAGNNILQVHPSRRNKERGIRFSRRVTGGIGPTESIPVAPAEVLSEAMREARQRSADVPHPDEFSHVAVEMANGGRDADGLLPTKLTAFNHNTHMLSNALSRWEGMRKNPTALAYLRAEQNQLLDACEHVAGAGAGVATDAVRKKAARVVEEVMVSLTSMGEDAPEDLIVRAQGVADGFTGYTHLGYDQQGNAHHGEELPPLLPDLGSLEDTERVYVESTTNASAPPAGRARI